MLVKGGERTLSDARERKMLKEVGQSQYTRISQAKESR